MMLEGRESVLRTLRDALWITVFAAVLGFAVNALHPRGFRLQQKSPDVNNCQVLKMEGHEAMARIQRGSLLVVDLRNPAEGRNLTGEASVSVPSYPRELFYQQMERNREKLTEAAALLLVGPGIKYAADAILDTLPVARVFHVTDDEVVFSYLEKMEVEKNGNDE